MHDSTDPIISAPDFERFLVGPTSDESLVDEAILINSLKRSGVQT